MSAVVAAALPAPAMFEDEIVYEDVYIPPQFEELPINSEGDGIKLATIFQMEKNGINIKIIRGHDDCINSAKFFCDDRKILTCSSDGTVRMWRTADGKELVQYENLHAPGATITKCDISFDNNRLISCGWDKKVKLTDAETGMFLWTGEHRGIVTDCNFSHDGKLVVSCSDLDRSIKLWDATSGKMVKEIVDMHQSTITKCCFDVKDVRVISTSMDKSCKFWDMKSGVNTITLAAHENVIADMACTENGQLLATCGWDKIIYLWDITTGMYRSHGPKALDKIHEGCISCVDFSSDGSHLVSGSYDKNIIVWDTTEHNVKIKLSGHLDWVTSVSFNKTGNWILSASRDKTIRLWNIADSDKIPAVTDNKKTVGLRVSTCTNCKKPFSVAMLDDAGTPGQTLCVFCRMEARPTIWSVVDHILNTEDFSEDPEHEHLVEVNHYDENSIVVEENNDDSDNKRS